MTSPQNGQTTTERFDDIEHVICSLVNLRSRGTRVATFDFTCIIANPEIENTSEKFPASDLEKSAI